MVAVSSSRAAPETEHAPPVQIVTATALVAAGNNRSSEMDGATARHIETDCAVPATARRIETDCAVPRRICITWMRL